MELKALLKTVNKQHKSIQKPAVDFEQYIENFSANESEYVKYQEQTNGFNPESVVDKKSIAADMDILFKILETTYGGYYYFGGDKAFGASKKAILNECNASDNVTGQALEQSIRKNLSIILRLWFNMKIKQCRYLMSLTEIIILNLYQHQVLGIYL